MYARRDAPVERAPRTARRARVYWGPSTEGSGLAISFGKQKEDDVVALIAAKKYGRAVEVLKEQLRRKGANPSLRMQLADVLILADKKSEAVSLLLPLADQFANEGFAAKAVSVLKKVQRIDPGRRDVESRLARLIQEKQREAAVLPSAMPGGAPGFEEGPTLEIGFDSMAPISAPAAPASSPDTDSPASRPDWRDPDGTLPADAQIHPPLLGRSAPAPAQETPHARPRRAPAEPESDLLPDLAPLTDAAPARLDLGADEPIADNDLLYLGDSEDAAAEGDGGTLELEPLDAAAEPMSAGQFADELMSLVDSVFQEFEKAPPPPKPAAQARPAAPGGSQIVVSPLFRDFSVDEMVAVIQGLKLHTFERGGVVLREGQPGNSLFMLTSGSVRAFRKDQGTGKQVPLADMKEGAFFGELSILTGQPRAASIVALTRCELLELDRPTLDEITTAHPHVWNVLREFAAKRGARR